MSIYHPGIRAGASQVFAVATAMCAVGFLTVPTPAQAVPMLPLAPACTAYQFNGDFVLDQSNGAHVDFNSTGPVASGIAFVRGSSEMVGDVSGGVQGRNLDFTIQWDEGPRGHYTGTVGEDGLAFGRTVDMNNLESRATWHSTSPLQCITPPAAPAPADPAPQQVPAPAPATAVLGAVVNGPATLQAGLSGTYVVTVSNTGGVKAPVELFIIFAGKLEQTGAQGGSDCQLQSPAAGVNATVRCVLQLEPGAKSDIVVQGRGSVSGAGTLLAKIGNDVSQKNVSIT
jgi:hypothetical protein